MMQNTSQMESHHPACMSRPRSLTSERCHPSRHQLQDPTADAVTLQNAAPHRTTLQPPLSPHGWQGADEAIFALATILLLLARDPVLLPGLSEARRYAPYAAAVGCYLGASAVGQMLSGASTRTVQQAWWARLGDAAALLLAAPQHYLFPQVTCSHGHTEHDPGMLWLSDRFIDEGVQLEPCGSRGCMPDGSKLLRLLKHWFTHLMRGT